MKRIFVKDNYSGLQGNYARDIAILQIDRPFKFSTILMPACLDIRAHSDRSVLEDGNYGRIAGFGITAGARGHMSQVLQSLTVPYVSFKKCGASIVDPEYRKFLTDDKFCAGYRNGEYFQDSLQPQRLFARFIKFFDLLIKFNISTLRAIHALVLNGNLCFGI